MQLVGVRLQNRKKQLLRQASLLYQGQPCLLLQARLETIILV
jgi:hypothetical protein